LPTHVKTLKEVESWAGNVQVILTNWTDHSALSVSPPAATTAAVESRLNWRNWWHDETFRWQNAHLRSAWTSRQTAILQPVLATPSPSCHRTSGPSPTHPVSPVRTIIETTAPRPSVTPDALTNLFEMPARSSLAAAVTNIRRLPRVISDRMFDDSWEPA